MAVTSEELEKLFGDRSAAAETLPLLDIAATGESAHPAAREFAGFDQTPAPYSSQALSTEPNDFSAAPDLSSDDTRDASSADEADTDASPQSKQSELASAKAESGEGKVVDLTNYDYTYVRYQGGHGDNFHHPDFGPPKLNGSDKGDRLTGNTRSNEFNGHGGADTMSGGAGSDKFFLANGDFAAGESIDGGADADTIILKGAGTYNLSAGTVTGVETLTGSDGIDTVTLSSTQFTSFTTINLGAGADVLNVNVSGTTNLSTTTFPALSGAETVALTGSAVADAVTLSGIQANTFTKIDLAGGSDSLILTATSTGLNALSDANLVNVETISAAGAAAAVTINLASQTEAFTITGSSSADSIAGGAGADTITGGAGADSMAGGAGADAFNFATIAEFGDTFADFTSGVDHLVFDHATIASLDTTLRFDLGTAPTKAGASFYFDAATHQLFYDEDGTGAAHAGILVATIQAGGTIAPGDITII